ncbi:MAG: dihydrodipicolinate synthase family protein [Chloracidobacterium sp.]|nr:dihydrodipicolinate synthase family protein [Chloracidobacterium sp.]
MLRTNKPTQEGIFAHYSEIAKSVKGFPIMLYNVPSRTASNISADTTLRLAKRLTTSLRPKSVGQLF